MNDRELDDAVTGQACYNQEDEARTEPADSPGRSEAGRQGVDCGSQERDKTGRGQGAKAQAQRSAEERENLDTRLKAIRDHGDVAAHLLQDINIDRVTQGVLAERRCGEMYRHGNVGFIAHLRRIGSGKAQSRDFIFPVGFPIGQRQRNLLKYSAVMMDSCISRVWQRHVFCNDAVLIGIREAVNDKEQIFFRVWLSIERLQVPDFLKPRCNARERTVRIRGTGSSDAFGVVSSIGEDGKLVLVPNGCITRIDEGGNDVVECTPQIVYEVAHDKAEAVFREIARREKNRTPTAIWVDLADPDGVRLALIEDRQNLSLERFKVYARPCDLCG